MFDSIKDVWSESRARVLRQEFSELRNLLAFAPAPVVERFCTLISSEHSHIQGKLDRLELNVASNARSLQKIAKSYRTEARRHQNLDLGLASKAWLIATYIDARRSSERNANLISNIESIFSAADQGPLALLNAVQNTSGASRSYEVKQLETSNLDSVNENASKSTTNAADPAQESQSTLGNSNESLRQSLEELKARLLSDPPNEITGFCSTIIEIYTTTKLSGQSLEYVLDKAHEDQKSGNMNNNKERSASALQFLELFLSMLRESESDCFCYMKDVISAAKADNAAAVESLLKAEINEYKPDLLGFRNWKTWVPP